MLNKRIVIITFIILIATSGLAMGQYFEDSMYLQDKSLNQSYSNGDTIDLNLGLTPDNVTYYETNVTYNPEYIEFHKIEDNSSFFTYTSDENGRLYVSAEGSKPISKENVAMLRFKVRNNIRSDKTVEFGLSSSKASLNGTKFVDLSEQGTEVFIDSENKPSISDFGIEVDGSATVERDSSTTITAYPYRLDVDGDEEYVENVGFGLVVDKDGDGDYTDHDPVSQKDVTLDSGSDINLKYDSVSLSSGQYGYKVFARKSGEFIESQKGTLTVNKSENSTEEKIDIVGIEIPATKSINKNYESNNKLSVYPNYYGSPIDDIKFKAVLDTDKDGNYDNHILAEKSINLDETRTIVTFNQFNTDIKQGTYDYKVFAEKSGFRTSSYTSSKVTIKDNDSISDLKLSLSNSQIRVDRGDDKSIPIYPSYQETELIEDVKLSLVVDKDSNGQFDEEPVETKFGGISPTTFRMDMNYDNVRLEEGSYNYTVYATKSGHKIHSENIGSLLVRQSSDKNNTTQNDTKDKNYNLSFDYDNETVLEGETFNVGVQIKGENITGYKTKIDHNKNYLKITSFDGLNFADPQHTDFNKYISVSAEKSSNSYKPKILSIEFKTSSVSDTERPVIELKDMKIYSNGDLVEEIESKEIQVEIESESDKVENKTESENKTQFKNETEYNETESENKTQFKNETEYGNSTQPKDREPKNNSSIAPENQKQNEQRKYDENITSNNTNQSSEPQINRSIVRKIVELFAEQNNKDIDIESSNNTTSEQQNNDSVQKDNSTNNNTYQNDTSSQNSTSLTDIIVELFS